MIRKVYGECDECVKEALLKHEGGAARDDILDALAAAVTARFGFNALKTLPEAPERDEEGLPMEMVHYDPLEMRSAFEWDRFCNPRNIMRH